MKIIMTLAVMAAITVPVYSTAATPSSLDRSQWEFEITYNLVGIPQTFPTYKLAQCLSSDAPFPPITRPGQECKTHLQGKFGNTYTWTVDCSDDWEVIQGMGRIRFDGEEASGEVYLQILNPHNPPQMMEYNLKGRYLGECKG